MSLNNGKFWIPTISLILALGGAYVTAQVSVTEKLGEKANRQELKEAVQDTRDQIRRELNDVKKRQDETYEQIQETNRMLRHLMLKNGVQIR